MFFLKEKVLINLEGKMYQKNVFIREFLILVTVDVKKGQSHTTEEDDRSVIETVWKM